MPIIQPNQPVQTQQEAQGRKERGTGFTNIARLLGANVGAGQQMGSAIGQSIANKAGQVQQGVEKSAQQFKTGFEQGKQAGLTPIQQAGQLGGQVTAEGQIGQPSGAQSLSGMSEEQAKDIGKQLAETKYTGPKGLQNASQLTGQASYLQNVGKAAMGSTAGQRELLRSFIAQPGQYTRGQSVLDSALLGQNQQAQRQIQAAGQQALQGQKNVMTQQALAQQQANVAQNEIERQKAETKQNLIQNIQNVQAAGEKQAKEYYKTGSDIQNAFLKLSQGISPSKLSNEEIQALKNAGEYGIDVNKIIIDPTLPDTQRGILGEIAGLGATAYTGGQLMTPEQQTAAKNLAFLTQQPELASSVEGKQINKNLFNASEENVAKGSAYQAQIDELKKRATDEMIAAAFRGGGGIDPRYKHLFDYDTMKYYAMNPYETYSQQWGDYLKQAPVYKNTGQYINFSQEAAKEMLPILQRYETNLIPGAQQNQNLVNTLQKYIQNITGDATKEAPIKNYLTQR